MHAPFYYTINSSKSPFIDSDKVGQIQVLFYRRMRHKGQPTPAINYSSFWNVPSKLIGKG